MTTARRKRILQLKKEKVASSSGMDKINATPAAIKLIAKLKLTNEEILEINGTGTNGKIGVKDVKKAME